MDQLHLEWGVQYELARGVSLQQWTWEDVLRVLREKPKELQGSKVYEPKIPPLYHPILRMGEKGTCIHGN